MGVVRHYIPPALIIFIIPRPFVEAIIASILRSSWYGPFYIIRAATLRARNKVTRRVTINYARNQQRYLNYSVQGSRCFPCLARCQPAEEQGELSPSLGTMAPAKALLAKLLAAFCVPTAGTVLLMLSRPTSGGTLDHSPARRHRLSESGRSTGRQYRHR